MTSYAAVSPDSKQLLRGYLAAAATLLMWTGFSLVSRLGGKSVLTPYDIFALRLITASLVLLPFARSLPAGWWRDGRLWLLIMLGNLIYCLFVYQGFQYAPAAHGAILLSGLQPFWISAIVWLLAGTRPNRMRLLGLAAIAVGMVCAARPYFSATGDTLFGDALILVGSLCWGFYTVLATRWGYSGWTLTRAIAFGSAIVYLPVYFLLLPKQLAAAPVSMIVIQAVFQGIIATIVAMVTYLKAISILGPERAVVFLALVPIVTGIIAVPLLGEALTGWLLAGLVFVSLGSFIASRYGAAKAKVASTAVISTPVRD